ncbi:hypothetical protein EV360DRAFT_78507 [Lentinula raphanica]|nr:hypothetical protein EV360DRAFT_78507 [Lentinula raphanica]
MQVYLPPPLDLTALPKQRPAASKLNDRMKVINNPRTLKRIMSECVAFRLKTAPRSFGFGLVPSSNMNFPVRFKTAYKTAGVKVIENAIKDALSWNGVDRADLSFHQSFVGRFFLSRGLPLVVEHLHPQSEDSLLPSAITSLAQGFLLQVGRDNSEITTEHIQSLLMFNRQPLAGFEGTVEEAKVLMDRIFFSDFLSSEIAQVPAAVKPSLKRGREDDSAQLEGPSPLKKAKFKNTKANNRSTIFTRLRRKRLVTV